MEDTNETATEISPGQAQGTGPIWSAILAAAVGCATLGILTLLTEISVHVSHLLTFVRSAGDLSGVTTLSLAIWLITWVLLHQSWKTRAITAPALILVASVLLILVGLLGTFPPLADCLSGK
jgi:hypothetical protein